MMLVRNLDKKYEKLEEKIPPIIAFSISGLWYVVDKYVGSVLCQHFYSLTPHCRESSSGKEHFTDGSIHPFFLPNLCKCFEAVSSVQFSSLFCHEDQKKRWYDHYPLIYSSLLAGCVQTWSRYLSQNIHLRYWIRYMATSCILLISWSWYLHLLHWIDA